MLYVESANAPALGLYYDLGFTLHHVERAFVLDGCATSRLTSQPIATPIP